MKSLIKICLVSLLLFSAVFGENTEDEEVTLNFVNTPLAHLTKMISEITGLNFVSTEDIPGNFTFVSQKPIQKSNLMDIYEMILRTKGYMVVNYADKGFFMIVKNSDSQKQDIPFGGADQPFQMATEIVHLKYFKPSEIAKIITPFMSPYGKISANDELSYIMITDYPDGIEKIRTITQKMDKQKDVELKWVKMNHVNVKTVFPQIKEISEKLAEKYRKPINVYMDTSSNSVIIAASGKDYEEVEGMVKKIDYDNKVARKAEVIFLKNSVAEEVIKILQEIEKSRYENGEKEDGARAAISMDKSLNAIIVLADEDEVNTYRGLIESLDRPRKQVFVRADIVEISEDKSRNLGIELDNILGGGANGSGGWALVGNVNSQGKPAIDALSLLGVPFDKINNGIAIGGFINLLKKNGIARTLSTPTLLCLDNQESSIYVGKNMPAKSSSTQPTNKDEASVTNYDYKDIGLTLKVKPQIMNDSKVRLDISTKLEELISGADAYLPATTKREVESTSIVSDGQDVVIAGLIKTLNDSSENKIPLLGDIPFLGGLFTHEVTRNERVNLVIVLTPYVVNEEQDMGAISERIRSEFKALDVVKHEEIDVSEYE